MPPGTSVASPIGSRILAGPCDSSRSACSRGPTSTGSCRWSRSRSPSAAGARGRARGRRPAARSSTSAGPSPRATGRTTSRTSSPGRAACARTTTSRAAPVIVHRASDAGRWLVTWPWSGAERARLIADASFDLASRSVHPGRRVRLTGTQQRVLDTWTRADRRAPVPRRRRGSATRSGRCRSCRSPGTNGKSTVTRLITHILLRAGHHVGTTTSDGILVDERMVDAGDWTGPGGAAAILRRSDVDVAVLETARGGLVLKGMGYESNEASVFTNVSSDHLDLQGIHTLPELAEVKSTVCRVTKADGWTVLNADDPYVAAVARRVRSRGRLLLDGPRPLAGHRPPPAATAAAATSSAAASCSSGTVTTSTSWSTSRTCRSRSAASPATTSRTRSRRRAAHAASARRRRAGRGRAARLPAVRGPVAGAHEPVPARPADGDRRLRPQRGRHDGDPRRRGGHRGRRGGPRGADHRDHRHGRRPPRRHPPGHRADRRRAGAAGRDQGDARLPPRPRPREHRGHDPRGRRRGRHGPLDRAGLRRRGRGARGGARRARARRRRRTGARMRRGS